MGGKLITNDTLQITTEQGFPAELNLAGHLKAPISLETVKGRLFSFTKPELRFYQPYGIRVALVENIGGKWVYWGMIFVHQITLDYRANTTSGVYEIVDIFPPERMKEAFAMRDARPEFDYFA